MSEKRKLIVIDGNSLLFRAYYATSYGDASSIMRSHDGTPTNAIFAFANMMSKILSSFKGGESIFVGFDADSKTFRKAEFEDYKANRKPCPPELIPQFPLSREFLDAIGVLHYEESGIEADDICGTIAKLGSKAGYEVAVYTSDKDYLQLIDDSITVNLLKTGLSNIKPMTTQAMIEEWGFGPKSIIDYKGLCGDSSDNLPGIPGIGDKSAKTLIATYGSFEGIITAAKEGKLTKKMGENIINNEALGRECYKLATILTDCKLPFELEDLLYEGYDFAAVSEFAKKLDLKTLAARLPVSLKKAGEDTLPEIIKASSIDGFEIGDEIGLAIDIDFSAYHDDEPLGIALSNKKAIIYLEKADFINDSKLKEVLENPKIKKCLYDGKATIVALSRYGINLKGIDFDVLLASYLTDSSFSSNPDLAYSCFGADVSGDDNDGLMLLNPNKKTRTGKMAYFALNKKNKAIKTLAEENSLSLYENIEAPLSLVLASMEIEGFPLNKEELKETGELFKAKRDALEKEVYECAGAPFNISSPKQVAEVLFGILGLKDLKGGSTSVEVLNALKDEHPAVSKILEYRKYAKLYSTYIEGLIPHVKSDGKVHTIFNQTGTTTGRLSSSNPNLQNITARDEESRLIKKAFHYEIDLTLVSIDYSQIELRVLASLSKCQTYIDVFSSNRDVHEETARRIFNVPNGEEVPSILRRRAKAVNFAIIYGTTPFGLSEQIGCSPKEASQLIESFYTHYPEILAFLNSITAMAKEKGYVETMMGRRRYIREINDANFAKREAARRAALNAPVQGSAADLMKMAMIKIDQFLKENKFKTKMVLQIHDELLFSMPKEEIDILCPKLIQIMENAYPLDVKLEVSLGSGKTWFDAKD